MIICWILVESSFVQTAKLVINKKSCRCDRILDNFCPGCMIYLTITVEKTYAVDDYQESFTNVPESYCLETLI